MLCLRGAGARLSVHSTAIVPAYMFLGARLKHERDDASPKGVDDLETPTAGPDSFRFGQYAGYGNYQKRLRESGAGDGG